MALTEPQKADVRLRLGWSARFHQFDSRLEQALSALATEAAHEDQVISLLASCADIDAKLVDAHARLKADNVGSIALRRIELLQLQGEGRRFVGRLAAVLGVEVRQDIYSGNLPRGFASFDGMDPASDNWIGK